MDYKNTLNLPKTDFPMKADLPARDASGCDPEEGMSLRSLRSSQVRQPADVADGELLRQVRPLVAELSRGRDDPLWSPAGSGDPACVETVAAPCGLLLDGTQVPGDGADRSARRSEPLELGVVPVPARAIAQNRLCQEALAPQRDQATTVQVLGVQGPQAHQASARSLAARRPVAAALGPARRV